MPNEQTASGAQVPCISLLAARADTIKSIVDKLGGEECKETDAMARVMHNLVVSAVKEAAGMGFDAGFKLAANTGQPTGSETPK